VYIFTRRLRFAQIRRKFLLSLKPEKPYASRLKSLKPQASSLPPEWHYYLNKTIMELTAGYPFWLMNDGLPFRYNKLLENASSTVTILGGGISGALTAYYLTEAGVDCILLDARTIGLGSTCASTSLLQYELDKPLHQMIREIGEHQAVRAYQLCGESIDLLEAIATRIGYQEFDKRPSLFFTTHDSQLSFMKAECVARKNAGFEVSQLSRDELQKNYGLSAAHAIRSEKGATINAYSFTHALLQYCMGKGLRVYDRTNVTGIIYGEHRVELKTEDGFVIYSGKLVNASGFEIVHFISKNIVDLYCTYAVVSENEQENPVIWKDRAMIWNTDDPYLYIRLTQDNRILIGGRDVRFSNRASRKLYAKKSGLLEKDFKKIFPDVHFKKEFAWSGTFGKTKDALPYIGPYTKTPGTYYALGFGGNGITFSVIAAQIIADFIMGKKNADAGIFAFDRKKK
jgi:glycine/D-amino acid oxidase-like deaminating enzyme